jgi:hypothetical protein
MLCKRVNQNSALVVLKRYLKDSFLYLEMLNFATTWENDIATAVFLQKRH